jgi:hypothetical protein
MARGWGNMGPKERKEEMARRRTVAANKKLQETPKSSAESPAQSILKKVSALHEEIASAIAFQEKKISALYEAA